MTNYYLPPDDSGKSRFLTNYAAKLTTYATTLGIGAADLQQASDDAANFETALKATSAFQAFGKTVTTYKNFLRDGAPNGNSIGKPPEEPAMPAFTASVTGNIFGRLSKQVQAIKAHPNYTLAIGNDLAINGAGKPPVDHATLKPVLGHTLLAGKPNITWKKHGHQGIHVYVDRGDGKGYGPIPYTDTKPDFLDEYPLPAAGQTAMWKYKAIYLEDDVEIGSMSNELSVSVAAIV